MTSLSGQKNMVIQLLPVQPFVDAGVVALEDAKAFMETETGIRIASSSLQIAVLEEGTALWVPWGWMAIALWAPGEDDKDFEHGFCWSLPLFQHGLCSKVSSKAWAAIVAMNESHLAKLHDKPAWQARKEIFSKWIVDQATLAAGP